MNPWASDGEIREFAGGANTRGFIGTTASESRLQGVLTYCESLHSFESGTHEIRNLFVKTAHSCILLEFLINARGESINRP